jgi:hypothetical protein
MLVLMLGVSTISALRSSNGWVEGLNQVRKATVDFFREHFDSEEWKRPTLDGVEFPVLSEENNRSLTALFTLVEIEEVVKASDGSKSPGPDGYNFAFIKRVLEFDEK